MLRSHQRFKLGLGLTVLVLMGILISAPVVAQDSSDGAGWSQETQCLGDLPSSTPRSAWDFAGTLFNVSPEALRGLRTDIATSYIVLSVTEEDFVEAGVFSPSGEWFAYPIGFAEPDVVPDGSDRYVMQAVGFISTRPTPLMATETEWRYREIGPTAASLPAGYWLDEERMLYLGQDGNPPVAIDRSVDAAIPWEEPISVFSYVARRVSPDESAYYRPVRLSVDTLAFRVYDAEGAIIAQRTDFTVQEPTIWLDNQRLLSVAALDPETPEALSLVLLTLDAEADDGVSVTRIADDVAPDFMLPAPQGDSVALVAGDRLLLLDLAGQRLVDLCELPDPDAVNTPFYWQPALAWSPDGTQLAFSEGDQPVLLDTASFSTTVLDAPTGPIIGWYDVPR